MTLANDARAMQMTRNAGIRFTENRGQVADTEGNPRPEILYTADAQGARLYFTARGVSYAFRRAQRPPSRVSEATGRTLTDDPGAEGLATEATMTSVYRMDMLFEGANPLVRVRAEDLQRGYTNYYDAHCPDGITYVRSFGTIIYEDLYEKIDLVYRASTGRVKYEFIVHPGGDPADIRLRYSGAAGVTRDADGGLAIGTPLGAVQEETPYSYQGSTPVASSFVVDGNAVRFEVGAYDAARELVIDPWSTYYGGNSEDELTDVGCDASGNIYVAGVSASPNFPVSNAFQATKDGAWDLVAVKFDASGQPLWSTFYGGYMDEGTIGAKAAIAVSPNGMSVVAGSGGPDGFPVTAGAFQSVGTGTANDCVLVVFDTDGIRQWATYYGGSGEEVSRTVALDAQGNIVLAGYTNSTDLPVYRPQQGTHGGTTAWDGFLAKFTSDGRLCWGTYFGGSAIDMFTGVDTDASSNVIATGGSLSSDFPVTAGAMQSSLSGTRDAIAVQFDSSGVLAWSTYLGGGSNDFGRCVSVDGSNAIYLGGYTESANFPLNGGFQGVLHGARDGFIARLSPGGALLWSTFYGGSQKEDVAAITVSGNSDIFLYGSTDSPDLPVLNAAFSGAGPQFVAQISSMHVLSWATYFQAEAPHGITTTVNSSVVIAGMVFGNSTTFPVLNAFQPAAGGTWRDGFVATFGYNGYFPVALASLTATVLDECALLSWRTEAETDNAGFIIERALPAGGDWEHRGFVAGAGTTNAPQHYSFTDALPPSLPPGAQLRYRLRQMDLDGRETLSPVVTVAPAAAPSAAATLLVFPNPAAVASQAELRLQREGYVTLALYDRLGRKLRPVLSGRMPAGTHAVALNLAGLAPGVYYLRAEHGGGVATARVLVDRRR